MPDMRDIWKKLNKLGRYGGYGGLKGWVLYTLSERPKNGAEIMDSIELMSYGAWRPSPGSIYPLLNKMVEERLVRKMDDGRYELIENMETDSYDNMWGSGSRSVSNIMTEMDSYLAYLEDLPKDKVAPYEEKLRKVQERIERLKESLHR
jgi:DNA-binding PadR family transcriptional regulator